MKRLHIFTTLTFTIASLAVGSSPLLASGDDSRDDSSDDSRDDSSDDSEESESDDETEITEAPQTSVPRRERDRNTNPNRPSNSVAPPTTVNSGTSIAPSVPPSAGVPATGATPIAPTGSAPKERRSSTSVPGGSGVLAPNDDRGDDKEDDANDDRESDDDNEIDDNEIDDNEVDDNEVDDNEGDDKRDDEERRGRGRDDLSKNITRAITSLNALPSSEARDAALVSLAALQVRLEAGEIIPTEEVRSVFAEVAALVHVRLGGDSGDDEIPEVVGIPDDQQLPRLLGVVNEALRLLEGNSSDAAAAAVAALESVKATLDAGTLPDREVFEDAIDLAKEALKDQPTARAAMTLAGVIAAVEASNAPEAVKAQLLVVLRAAQEQVLNNPTADARQIVRDALREVRDARIAAAVARIVAIIERLEIEATEMGNPDALLLLAQARSIVQPADGSQPTRNQLHEARHILRDVIKLLTPITAPETTIPETTIPDTTSPDTTIPETTSPETTSPDTTVGE